MSVKIPPDIKWNPKLPQGGGNFKVVPNAKCPKCRGVALAWAMAGKVGVQCMALCGYQIEASTR